MWPPESRTPLEWRQAFPTKQSQDARPAGSSGRHMMYYRLTTGAKIIYTTFVVLPDGRVADFDFTRD